jgi:hypothetical protein
MATADCCDANGEVIRSLRAAVLDLERVAQEAAYAADRARERLTLLELDAEGMRLSGEGLESSLA